MPQSPLCQCLFSLAGALFSRRHWLGSSDSSARPRTALRTRGWHSWSAAERGGSGQGSGTRRGGARGNGKGLVKARAGTGGMELGMFKRALGRCKPGE